MFRWFRAFVLFISVFFIFENVNAQTTQAQKPPRRFFTFYLDWDSTIPVHFKEYPLEQFAGAELGDIYEPRPERYRNADESITVSNIGFSKSTQGAGLMVYPFGTRKWTTLAIKAGYQELPPIRFDMKFPDRTEHYRLVDGKAYDLGVGLMISDLRHGWGLGSTSYVLVGKGWIVEPRGRGDRYFFEAGGGIHFGPIGIGIHFGLVQNRLSVPQTHTIYTAPVGLRTTLTF
jgi:hypothetical protein